MLAVHLCYSCITHTLHLCSHALCFRYACVCALHALVLHALVLHIRTNVALALLSSLLSVLSTQQLYCLLHTNSVRVPNRRFYVIDCCSPRGQCGVLPEQAVGGRRGQPIGAGVSGATEGPDLSCHDHHQGGSRGNHHQVRTMGLGRTCWNLRLIWETRKKELYGDQDCVVSGCSCSCPLTGGLTSSACVCGCVVNGVSTTAAT